MDRANATKAEYDTPLYQKKLQQAMVVKFIAAIIRRDKNIKPIFKLTPIDGNDPPDKLASEVAKIIETVKITPQVTTKISPFDAHMSVKLNMLLSNIATTSSPINLSWENTKRACMDQKNLMYPPLQPDIRHDLQCQSEVK